MTYDQVVKFLQTMLEIPLNQTDENFDRVLPQIIQYAENRIYRDLDFVLTTNNVVGALVAGVRLFTVPANVLIVRSVRVITTKRHQLTRVSTEALDMFWPDDNPPGMPQMYTIAAGREEAALPQVFQQVMRVGPTPDAAYAIDFLSVVRPDALSASNFQTLLTVDYPDLFCAACMVFASGYQRDFGAQSDDPQKAMSWEGQYNTLKQGVMLEAMRQRGEGVGWTAYAPAPLAGQPRGGAGA